ncbi:MAG: hypothetical protein IJ759_00150 [Bacteroidales bacterium]|nr:hypothetical protein [Bacteroidales bacterium]
MCRWYKTNTDLSIKYRKKPPVFMTYTYLLEKAVFSETFENGVLLQRGELFTTLNQIAKENSLSIKQVRTAIDILIRDKVVGRVEGNIEGRVTDKRLTRFIVYNYDCYEDLRQDNGRVEGNIDGDVEGTLNKNIKNINPPIFVISKDITHICPPTDAGEQEKIFIENAKNNTSLNAEESGKKEKSSAKKERKVFIKPTIQEIADYCKERQNNISAEIFFDFYESKGWMIGKNPMKDWRAAVRTWERTQHRNKNDTNHANNTADFRTHIDPTTDYGQSDIIT